MKALSILSLLAFLTLSAPAITPLVPFTVSLSITAQIQSSVTNRTTTTLSVPAFTKSTLTTKNLLPLIALDEFKEGHYAFQAFPAGAKLVLLADPLTFEVSSYAVEDKNGNELVEVSDLMNLQVSGGITVFSFDQSISTDLYKPFVRGFAGIFTFDDTGIGGGVQFSIAQTAVSTTTETESSTGVFTESASLKLSAGAGTATFGDENAILTCGAQTFSGKRILGP
jgi:hypothetical protein